MTKRAICANCDIQCLVGVEVSVGFPNDDCGGGRNWGADPTVSLPMALLENRMASQAEERE